MAAKYPHSVVLIGAQASRPEVEYGWIEPGASVGDGRNDLLDVRGFWEKPSLEMAETLLRKHSAWNTFVMVGRVQVFLEMIAQAIPDVFKTVRQAGLWMGSETHIDESVYDQIPSSDFSGRVLSAENARLLVLRVHDLGWSDLGHPGRVLAVLEDTRSKPRWLEAWKQAKPAAVAASSEADSAVA
jgi:mannose-1-phosphate guanylyltransferase